MIESLFGELLPSALCVVLLEDPSQDGLSRSSLTSIVSPCTGRFGFPENLNLYSIISSNQDRTLGDLLQNADRIYVQSVHSANADLLLELHQSPRLAAVTTVIMADDEIERLYIRQSLITSGLDPEVVSKKLWHTEAMSKAYMALRHAVVIEPFGRVLRAIVGPKVAITPMLLPIQYSKHSNEGIRALELFARASASSRLRMACYTKAQSVREWETDFTSFIAGESCRDWEPLAFGPRGLIREVKKRFFAPLGLTLEGVGVRLPLASYLSLIESLDCLYIQPRGGMLTIRHAVRNRVALVANFHSDGFHFNLETMKYLGIYVFPSIAAFIDAQVRCEVDAILNKNAAKLKIQEAQATLWFLEAFQ